MWTPLVTAVARFIAAIGGAVMAFRNMRSEADKYEKKKLEENKNQQQ